MKKILTLLFLLLLSSLTQAQLPNLNTYLIKQLDNYSSYSGIWGYVAPNGNEYAILGCDTGTSFVNITDSANVYQVDFVRGPLSQWREMKTYSHYAYVVSEGTNSRLQIIDLQYLPDSVNLITAWNAGGVLSTCHAISQSGPYLYLSGNNASFGQGVQIVDVTDPINPVRRGGNNTRYVHDVRVRNDTIWACNILNSRVTIINAVNKDNLQEVRTLNSIHQGPHNNAISNGRKYIFISHETEEPGPLDIWNIEDLENMTYVMTWQPTGITTSVVHNVEIYDTLALVAHYTAGIRIIDISDPSQPEEVAWYDTRPQDNGPTYQGCWGVYKFPSGKIIGSDVTNGLFVIRQTFATSISNSNITLRNFHLNQNYPNPFNPTTSLSYELRVSSYVSLKVYDVLGNEVKTLVNDKQNSGSYSLDFNGENFPSGVYYYKLSATNESNETLSETRKMILLK